MNTTTMITARNLTKSFAAKGGSVSAVRGIDLDVAPGELVAFLGPNGAGKSTTLRMLTTLLQPTSGEARVAGFSVAGDPGDVRRRIGLIGQKSSASNNQRVRDELRSQGAFYGLSRRTAHARADELLDSLELSSVAMRQVQSLSGGQRRRLDIALGLIHDPAVLFLDEPSTGLDPHSRANLWQHILDLRTRTGTTIFLTTHYLDEADQLAERVMVMDHGEVIADDSATALKHTLAGDSVRFGFADEDDARAAAALVGGIVEGERVSIASEDGERGVPQLLRQLDASGVHAVSAEYRRPTLDDVFLALTGRSLRDEGAAHASPPDAARDDVAAPAQ
ncbi:ATP-binding cassette domain-containing protein [Paramicrobacterium agarici]|uniref:ATP-binding cassette domain-containing protein n=1 Tax=Paramicrobacterium agarici TaxID=630514 RepID=UPI0011745EDB|nr:ATP-binding cassette domain-containing protein [Microbacterium agarici]TQO22456.1 ABC-2 type transport system ATP-binding protein [Microbacterium agarici]